MDLFEKLYTVDDIAKMTGLTSRTIRNYLKNGSLEGKKIGGQWRFTKKNIEKLFESSNTVKDIQSSNRREVVDFVEGKNNVIKGEIQVCTVIDYYGSKDKAKEISDKMIVIIDNYTDNQQTDLKFNYTFDGKESKVRFTLLGNPTFIIDCLKLFNE